MAELKRYAIADYLSDEDRQRILSHRYVKDGEPTGEEVGGEAVVYHGMVPVSVDDCYCPLAYVSGVDFNPSAPSASTVAGAIHRRIAWDYCDHDDGCECSERLLAMLEDAGAEFIRDWDHGRIPPSQLATALGDRP